MAIHYYPLINKILASLNLRDKILESHVIKEDQSFEKPFITVAREPGSGGAPIARAVAEKLGFELVDEQIIEKIASSTKKRKEVIKAVDEKHRGAIDDIVHSLMNREYVDDLRYVTELVKVVLAYASRGRVVILGRGANFITPFAKGLHVRFSAPLAVRVQRAVDHEGVSPQRAKEIISEVGNQRKAFVKQYFGQTLKKSNAYDMTINTTYLGMDESRDLVMEAFYRKFSKWARYSSLVK